jgi:hypothetical protein
MPPTAETPIHIRSFLQVVPAFIRALSRQSARFRVPNEFQLDLAEYGWNNVRTRIAAETRG